MNMKKSNMLMFILIGLILLTSCQTNAQDTTETTEQEAKVTKTQAKVTKTQADTTTQTKSLSDVSDYNFSVTTVGTGTPKFSESQF
jgi:uncharacterized lipoprotein YajG